MLNNITLDLTLSNLTNYFTLKKRNDGFWQALVKLLNGEPLDEVEEKLVNYISVLLHKPETLSVSWLNLDAQDKQDLQIIVKAKLLTLLFCALKQPANQAALVAAGITLEWCKAYREHLTTAAKKMPFQFSPSKALADSFYFISGASWLFSATRAINCFGSEVLFSSNLETIRRGMAEGCTPAYLILGLPIGMAVTSLVAVSGRYAYQRYTHFKQEPTLHPRAQTLLADVLKEDSEVQMSESSQSQRSGMRLRQRS